MEKKRPNINNDLCDDCKKIATVKMENDYLWEAVRYLMQTLSHFLINDTEELKKTVRERLQNELAKTRQE
jgi:hypothetical protein